MRWQLGNTTIAISTDPSETGIDHRLFRSETVVHVALPGDRRSGDWNALPEHRV